MSTFKIHFIPESFGVVCCGAATEEAGWGKRQAPVQSGVSSRISCTAFMFPALSVSMAVFFHLMSSQWLAGFVTHTFHKVSGLYLIAFEANQQKQVIINIEPFSSPWFFLPFS